MGGADTSIYAYSDVARDILQNSDYFTSVGKALNEYVWNSVDYCKPDERVEVRVAKQRGKITVRKHRTIKYNGIVVEETKNGGGMSRVDLQRFFTMHGETLARKEGRRVRGRFGTGKAAAFGVGGLWSSTRPRTVGEMSSSLTSRLSSQGSLTCRSNLF